MVKDINSVIWLKVLKEMLSMSCSGDAEKNHKHANWYCYMFITSNLSQAPVLPNGLTLHLTTWIRLSMPLQKFIIFIMTLKTQLDCHLLQKAFTAHPSSNSQPGLGALFWWDTSSCLSSSQGVKVICLFVSPTKQRSLRMGCFFLFVFPASYFRPGTRVAFSKWFGINIFSYTDFQVVQY